MPETFYWIGIPTALLLFLVGGAAILELASRLIHTPYSQAERRRKANERWKEIVSE